MKMKDSKGLTILGMVFYFLMATMIIFGSLVYVSNSAHARERLNLQFSVDIQYRQLLSNQWVTLNSKSYDGIGGLQAHLDSSAQYRMVLTVRKPFDLSGAFRVRMFSRVDGVALPVNTEKGVIIFGPQDGCQNETRCEPLSLNDVGQVELRLDLEKAQETALGIFNFRPYDESPPITIRTQYFYDGKEIACGSSVKKGWWIFAKKLKGSGSAVDTISICAKNPKGSIECADDRETEVKVRANRNGTIKFSLWNNKAIENGCEFYVGKKSSTNDEKPTKKKDKSDLGIFDRGYEPDFG